MITQVAVGGGKALLACGRLVAQVGVADDVHGPCPVEATWANFSLRRAGPTRIARRSHVGGRLRQNLVMPAHDASTTFAWAKIQPPQPRGLLVERRSLEQVLEQAL